MKINGFIVPILARNMGCISDFGCSISDVLNKNTKNQIILQYYES
jgi:hypothetical protein